MGYSGLVECLGLEELGEDGEGQCVADCVGALAKVWKEFLF